MDLGVSGLASGFDWRSLVDQLVDVERTPQKRLRQEQNLIQQRNNAYTSIKTQLSLLQSRIEDLQKPELFGSRTTSSSDEDVATLSASAGALLGSFSINVTQLATAARQLGSSNASNPLSVTGDLSAILLSDAPLSTAVTGGTFTINNQVITVDTAETIQDVLNKINAASGGNITASYDTGTDQLTLLSNDGSPIILGSSADTSNFLRAFKLSNNGTDTVTSSSALGGLKTTVSLVNANLATAIDDGGSGAGEFKINGVSISFDATSNSLEDVIERINRSEAGVTASYDKVNDRMILSNNQTGDLGVALEDVTGNFLAASGLTTGTLERGKDLIYKINDGDTLTSQSNTITEESSGLTGISITALDEGTTQISVSTDTSKIKETINAFITEYNKAQSIIDTNTASTTDAKGKVTAGILASESEASDLASKLRSMVTQVFSGLSGSINHLSDIGIESNGDDNTIALENEELLDDLISNDLGSLEELFSNSTSGLARQFADFLDKTIGDEGTLIEKQDSLTEDSGNIDTQIADLERLVESNRQRLIDSFVAMEKAQANTNQQLQYLQQQFK
ncbi:MAG: flagellar filament capping protein FliD [Verrucomicrobiota bacterium]|nr:flagellar filament capping protein FliD [Verrucomicrobiota bacterium]